MYIYFYGTIIAILLLLISGVIGFCKRGPDQITLIRSYIFHSCSSSSVIYLHKRLPVYYILKSLFSYSQTVFRAENVTNLKSITTGQHAHSVLKQIHHATTKQRALWISDRYSLLLPLPDYQQSLKIYLLIIMPVN